MKYAIFTDTTSDLTPEECKQIGIWPELFTQEVTCYGHIIDYSDVDQFYQRMDNNEFPAGELKTASGSSDSFSDILEHIIKNTDPSTTIVYVSTSPYISEGTVATGTAMMQLYREQHPERKFIYINSHSVSGGQALYLRYLAKYGGDNIEEYAEELTKKCIHLFTLRDFRYTAQSGRFNIVERIAMNTMSQLKISPWMFFPYDGKLTMNGQIFRKDLILNAWVQYYIDNRAEDANYVRICYGGAAEKERALKLAKSLRKHTDLTKEQIDIVHIGPIIASHTGTTILAFFFKQTKDRL